MDGSSKDRKFEGRLIRPLSRSDALHYYPEIVVRLMLGLLIPVSSDNPTGSYAVELKSSNVGPVVHIIPKHDYDKLLLVIESINNIPKFRSDPQQSFDLARVELGKLFH